MEKENERISATANNSHRNLVISTENAIKAGNNFVPCANVSTTANPDLFNHNDTTKKQEQEVTEISAL